MLRELMQNLDRDHNREGVQEEIMVATVEVEAMAVTQEEEVVRGIIEERVAQGVDLVGGLVGVVVQGVEVVVDRLVGRERGIEVEVVEVVVDRLAGRGMGLVENHLVEVVMVVAGAEIDLVVAQGVDLAVGDRLVKVIDQILVGDWVEEMGKDE